MCKKTTELVITAVFYLLLQSNGITLSIDKLYKKAEAIDENRITEKNRIIPNERLIKLLGQLSVSYLKELTAEANWFDRTKPENLGSLGANDKINYVEFVRRSKVPRKVVIIGDLFGSFVSLIRILNELKKLGYIDDELHLQENVELLFTGNFFGKNKLVMETLFIIFTLKQINPSSVFICGGKNERPEKLEKILASKKLFRTIFSSKNSEEIILIKNSLSSLFSLLPTAVTLFIRKKFMNCFSLLSNVILKIDNNCSND
jgi:hypothetical protein